MLRAVLQLSLLVAASFPLAAQSAAHSGANPAAPASAGDGGCAQAASRANSDGPSQTISNGKVCISVSKTGAFWIASQSADQRVTGQLPSASNGVRVRTGADALGPYREMVAGYGNGRTAVFRLYRQRPAVLLLDQHRGADRNVKPFPAFHVQPEGLLRASYRLEAFSPIDFGKLDSQGPWLFFDHNRNAMILSPADNFLVSDLSQAGDGEMQSGIDSQIETLPAGFAHGTFVVFGSGINRTLASWGKDLQVLHGKHPVSNDAGVLLKKFGYWTDNGAYYYYKFEPKLGYEGTLLAVKKQYRQLGVPIAYMQLDSWWYPKQKGYGPGSDNGAMVYRADPSIFPDGLEAFHRRMALPFVTHARWIAPASPYRQQYKMSKNVVIDPKFWTTTAEYLKNGGVTVYEQDWLDKNARPAINIAQAHQFLALMAQAMASEAIGIQYCMALPAYFMASTEFQNVRTIRTSNDRFQRSHWDAFLYTSALAHATGLWPWSDVFMSKELPNLALATLSAGPVGTGDALGTVNAANLKRVMRSDSVILKPDTPLMPIDAMYLADAAAGQHALTAPMVAATASDYGPASEHYVISYPRISNQTGTTISLQELGISSPVYAWNWIRNEGQVVPAGGALPMQYSDDWSYEVLAPINKAGIALLGDTTKIVPLARKRFAEVSNNGPVEATLVFAPGEASVPVSGYAASQPIVRSIAGRVGGVHYDPATHLFSFDVFPGAGMRARVSITARKAN